MVKYLPLTLLLTGCTFVPRATMEVGYISRSLNIGEDIGTRGDPKAIEGVHFAARMEADVLEAGPIIVDIGIGPEVVTAFNQPGEIYGAQVSNRIRWKMLNWLEPYLIQVHGIEHFEHSWGEEKVKYGFTTQFGAGTRIILTDKISISVDYRWWHNSWGRSFHGDWMRNVLGLEKEGPNFGFEGGALGVAFSYEW